MPTLKESKRITGHISGLGKPGKMPGYSTSLPAAACKRGAKLAKIPGTVCNKCYAMGGNYQYPDVQKGLRRRLEALRNAGWVMAMTHLIGHYTDLSDPYFRIHDSGDFQSQHHILKWVRIAKLLPDVWFWAPTRETRYVRLARKAMGPGGWPPNLVIRVSAHMIGGEPPSTDLPTSTVGADTGFICGAYDRDHKCGPCRACWNPSVDNVDYPQHR